MASERFCRVPAQALGNPRLKRMELQVLLAICLHANRTGEPVYVGQPKISALTGYSLPRVSQAIRNLEQEGILDKSRTRFSSGRLGAICYYVNWGNPPLADLEQVADESGTDEALPVADVGQDQLPKVGKTTCSPSARPLADVGQQFSPSISPIEKALSEAAQPRCAENFEAVKPRDYRGELLAETEGWYRGIGKGDSWVDEELGRTAAMALEREHDGDAAAALDAIRADGRAAWQAKVKADVNQALASILAAKRKAEENRYGGQS